MPDSPTDEQPEAHAIIGSYATARQAHEAGLSVLAAGGYYWLRVEEGRYLLTVPREHATVWRREIAIAERSNRFWPPISLDLPTRKVSKIPTAAFAFLLVSTFLLQQVFPITTLDGSNGTGTTLAQGEWWRIFTAVTLHADEGHLAGNLMGIALLGYLCCRYLGSGLAWFLIIAASGAANASSVLARGPEPYQSLGASTAVFSALGLLTGFPFGSCLRSRQAILTRDWLIPFCGGCVLFAWFGGGEFPTDIGAHLLGFAWGGVIAAFVAGFSIHTKLNKSLQSLLLATTYAIIVVSWGLALTK